MLQRGRIIVPFGEVAGDGGRILGGVDPFDAGPAHGRVGAVAADNEERHAVAIGVVERHRRVLQPDRAVDQVDQRLACDLGVAVRHRHRLLLMGAGEELGGLVLAVIDDRFLDGAEARPGIGGEIVEAQALEAIDHEVGAGELGGELRLVRRHLGLGGAVHRLRASRLPDRRRLGLGGGGERRRHCRRSAGQGRALEEAAPAEFGFVP